MRLNLLMFYLLLSPLSFPQIIVGYYYGNYSGYPPDMIEFNCLTHIAHAFIIPDSSGGFYYPDWFPSPRLISSAHENDKKIVISIGGWGNSGGFRPMAADPLKRSRFIAQLVNFIKQNGYDGADIDWEYPRADEKENYTSLISEMREAFDKAGIEILSAALPAMDWNNVFDIDILKEKFTWFGIMTYDFYGPWEKTTGHNTALYSTMGQRLSVDESARHYLRKGVPPNKLCVGMEFAGYQMNADSLYKFHNGGKSISYLNSLKKLKEGWEYNWDTVSLTPYYQLNDSIITIDDTASIRYKADYINENDIAGTIIWKLGLDYHNGYNELLNIIGERLISVIPGSIEHIHPIIYSSSDSSGIILNWTRSKGASKYYIQLSDKKDFSSILSDNYTDDETYRSELKPFNIYYLRLRGESTDGSGEWSDPITFSTFSSSEVSNEAFSYFPIDFSEEINLYCCPSDEYVSVTASDVYGNLMPVYQGNVHDGNIARINMSEMPGGTYEFRLMDSKGIRSFRIRI